MNDERIPLPHGSVISLNGNNYIIDNLIGNGGSCLAYSAQRKPSGYEHSIGIPLTPSVIKEFYPYDLGKDLQRDGVRLIIPTDKKEQFNGLLRRFEKGAVNQALFFIKDSDHSFAPTRIAVDNNTVYSAVDSVRGDILGNIRAELDMYEIAQIIQSLCYAVKELHDDGKLHLDIKPSNIFLFNKDSSESRRVAMFDFDTVTPMSELDTATISFSEDWSPYEQKNKQRDKISFATDIYAIGAVLYWLISGNRADASVLDDIKRQRFDFFDSLPVLVNKESPRNNLRTLLNRTLKREPSERSQNVEDLIE